MNYYGKQFWIIRWIAGDTRTTWIEGAAGAIGITAVIVWLIFGVMA